LAWDPQGPRAVAARHARLKLHLFWKLEAVAEYGRAHHWSPTLQDRSRITLISALNHRPAGTRLSRAELLVHGGPAGPLAPVLAQLGLLDDPPSDPLPALMERRAAGLPDGMRGDFAAWMVVLRDGGPRTKPKTYKTVQEYSRWVRPLLVGWGRTHEHLREITPGQVHQTLLAVPAGSARHDTFVAVRALFGFLHRDRRIFSNPTARTHLGTRHPPAILPLTAADYRRVGAHAATELHRVVLVLAAVHGARPHQIRALRQDDVNITGRHPTVADLSRDLDDLSVGALGDWLRHRQRRWPLSNNPHLLVGAFTSQDDRPLSAETLSRLFRGTGITLDQLRADRHLEEALAYGPDPLHLARTFGISTATGMRYANEAKHLSSWSARSHFGWAPGPQLPPTGL